MPYSTARLTLVITLVLAAIGAGCAALGWQKHDEAAAVSSQKGLRIEQDERAGTLSVFRAGGRDPILTQNARPDARPYLHPIAAPDGKGLVTELSPEHHKHQTGLYWGFTRLNGRDFFHNSTGDYWRRISATVTQQSGDEVRWQTVYDLLDAQGQTILTDTERWSMRERNGTFELDLEWRGEARTDVTIGKYDYGGLFLRMPWREGIAGEVVNAARQRNARAEGQRATVDRRGLAGRGTHRSCARRNLRPSGQHRLPSGLESRWPVRCRISPIARGRLDDQERRHRDRPSSLRGLYGSTQ